MGRWMVQGVLDLAVPAPAVGLLELFLVIGATDLSILDRQISKLFFQHGVQEERWPSGKRMNRGSRFLIFSEAPSICLTFRGDRLFYPLFFLFLVNILFLASFW